MNILVINGDCIRRNSSANLCHLAYIAGLVGAGHNVELLSAADTIYDTDSMMSLPSSVVNYKYNGLSLYEKFSLKKASGALPSISSVSNCEKEKKQNFKNTVLNFAKKSLLGLYGVHGIYITFVRNAAAFSSDKCYDYVISLSTPVTSHLLSHKLIKSGRVKCKHNIQLWEDPWFSDAYGFNAKNKIFKEEKRLLSFAEKVCYVSPLTLENQKKLYPEYADKMYWQPLPSYYKSEGVSADREYGEPVFGYFGDYVPKSRDILPFYNAASDLNLEVNICGNPSSLIESKNKIKVYPRLPLEKLKPIEDGTDVLVFVCNKRGGQIPGKIYQYAASNKTVLFILDGSEAEKKVIFDYFSKFNRFVFCENTVTSISEAVKKIKSGDIEGICNEPLEYFSPENVACGVLSGKSEKI